MLPVPTLEYLSNFSGRAVESYPAFAEQALAQATLLFSTVTRLQEFPADEDKAQLAINAILEMADRMVLEQPHKQTLASPFQSESIGSYSYAKSSTAIKAHTGQQTGLFWWDLAVDELTAEGSSVVSSGSVGGFEDDLGIDATTGRYGIAGPADGLADPPYIRIS